MSLCIQCQKPCVAHAICCETCQTSLETRLHQENVHRDPATSIRKGQGLFARPFMGADPPLAEKDGAWSSASLLAPLASSEQTVAKLRAAAQRMAEKKSLSKRFHRSGHLASLRDISADIQRASTVHPHIKRHSAFDTQPDQHVYLTYPADPHATEFYPCIGGTEKQEHDLWANATDPFLVRSRPTAAEAAHIEAADIQRVQLEEHATLRYSTIQPTRRRFSPRHLIFGSMIVLALSALLLDGLLLACSFYAGSRTLLTQSAAPQKPSHALPQVNNLYASPPILAEPLLDASPLNLNFSTIQAHANPGGQVFTIINNGGRVLNWQSTIITPGTTWITIMPKSGSVPPGSTSLVTVNVATTHLTPGTYTGQIMLHGTTTHNFPTADSPQMLTVRLLVQSPCTLAPPAVKTLLFNSSNLTMQTVTFMATGDCAWPLRWSTNVAPAVPWLTLTPAYGSLDPLLHEHTITANVNTSGLAVGTYSTLAKISAIDATGVPVPGKLQTFTITLTVQLACTLQLLPTSLVFSATQGAPPTSQTLTINTTGSCAGAVAWVASPDPNSSAWLSLSAHAGLATNSVSTLIVTVTPGNLSSHTYTGQITLFASNNGVILLGSLQTLNVTFTLTG